MTKVLHTKSSLILGIILGLCAASGYASADLVSYDLFYFEDIGDQVTIKEILAEEASSRFQKPSGTGLSFGWVENPYWVKMQLKPIAHKQPLLLEIPWPLLDKLNIYLVDANNNELESYALGDSLAFSERPIFDAYFVVPIDFSMYEIDKIYLQVQTTSSMQIPLEFWTLSDYFKHRAIYLCVQGIFYGFLLVMVFYNLFIYFSTGRVAYLHYVCFVISFSSLQLGLKGTGFQFIWPQTPWLNDYAIATGGSFSLLFLTLFARSFLQLSETPSLKKINSYMLVIASLFIFSSLVLPYRTVITPLTITVLVCSIIVIVAATIRYRQGFREARFYLLAWVVMVSGCFIYLCKQLGFLPINSFTENSLQIGSVWEFLLLSFALADRLNTLRTGLESANERLEQEVDDRTKELVNTLEKLSAANSKLAIISITDGLTGLYNRYHFDISLEKEIRRLQRNRGTISLLLLDVDHFKNINDTWGHVVGDRALQFIAECLGSIDKRQSDILCRYGGEEFAIILPGTNLDGAAKFAENIRTIIAETRFHEGEIDIPITMSIGVAALELKEEIVEPDVLLKAADFALYKAKEQGRNCVYLCADVKADRNAEQN